MTMIAGAAQAEETDSQRLKVGGQPRVKGAVHDRSEHAPSGPSCQALAPEQTGLGRIWLGGTPSAGQS